MNSLDCFGQKLDRTIFGRTASSQINLKDWSTNFERTLFEKRPPKFQKNVIRSIDLVPKIYLNFIKLKIIAIDYCLFLFQVVQSNGLDMDETDKHWTDCHTELPLWISSTSFLTKIASTFTQVFVCFVINWKLQKFEAAMKLKTYFFLRKSKRKLFAIKSIP